MKINIHSANAKCKVLRFMLKWEKTSFVSIIGMKAANFVMITKSILQSFNTLLNFN